MSESTVDMTRLALLALMTVALAACQSDRVITGSVPTSVDQRYPIGVIPERPKLDLNATGYGLSSPDRAMVEEFVLGWRERGTGGLDVLAPVGTANEAEAASVVAEVKAIAYNFGMPVETVYVTAYRTTQPFGPVRLSYDRLVAKLECGAWPTNIADNWRNVPYENFGCATQKNLAAMVEDPRDLAGPRPMTPRDAQRRDEVFDKYRRGEDPSTVYQSDETGQISEVGQ